MMWRRQFTVVTRVTRASGTVERDHNDAAFADAADAESDGWLLLSKQGGGGVGGGLIRGLH